MRVALYTSTGVLRKIDPTAYATAASNGWYRVSIPLSDLGAANTTITRVTLQENTGRAQPTFYLDALGFSR